MCLDEKAAWKESSSGKDFGVQRTVWFISLGIKNFYVCIFFKGFEIRLFWEVSISRDLCRLSKLTS